MQGGNKYVTVSAILATISVVIAGCGAPQQPDDPRPPTPVAGPPSGAWLEVSGAWPEKVTLPPEASPECIRYTGPHTVSARSFTAKTSDFADYDAGGETPGRDFEVGVHVPDASPYPDGSPSVPSVIVVFSDKQGRQFRLSAEDGKGATMTANDHDPMVTFEVTGNAASIDAEPILVRVSGQIDCESFVDKQ